MTERPSTPSSPVQRLIDRPRITSRLLERFDHPLTFVNGPAGSGKTSAINQAIQNNLLDPRGVDFLVTLPRNGADPLQLLARIASSLGVSDEAERSTAEIRERIVESVWSHAPDDVAVIVDDVHRVRASDAEQVGGIDELRQLLDEMPRNGHLVLVSRHDAPVPMARLRAHGSLCEINADTLDFDDSELDELRAARAAPTSRPLPRHAATADLQLAAGADAGADFLREEVLASLHPDRLRFLQGMAVFDEFDDALVQAMSDGAIDAETLLADLPLVEWGPDGTHRLHALLRETLLSQQPAGERRKAASIGAGLLLERSQHASAVQLHLLAGDEISARDAARECVLNPMLNQSIPEISEIRRLLATFDDTEPLRAVLEATLRFDGRDRDIADRFERAAMTARSVGDDVIEAVALHRTLQARFLDLGLGDEQRHLVDRLEELADTVPFAQGALAHARSQIAQHQGDPELALALLDAVDDAGEAAVVVNRNQRLCDLGHPEDVAVGLTPGDLDRLTAGDEVFIAFAMWLRGEGTPEFANEFVNAMLDDVAGRGFDSTTISMLGTATSIAIAAGDTATARRRRDQTQDLAQQGAPRTIRLFASIARASFEADQNTDEAAGAHLDPANTGVVLDPCPHRAHLLALPLIYTVRPETRPILEATRFGPSLTTAVAAGRALVALRDEGDIGPAAALPWSLSDLLRVHVLPHHLTELACAALRAGTPGAREALAQIPQLDRHLGRVATERRSPAAGQASDLLGRRPRRAPHTLRLDLLGDVRLLRDGEPVTDDDWVRRARVRELLALLAERRRADRHELIDLVWPGHVDDRRTDGNFRTHLSKLQHVLEPTRDRAVDPYFLRTEADVLVLHDDLRTDVTEFEERIETARRDDLAGAPARALEGYIDAMGWYRGDYLLGLQSGWPVLTRLRLRALAVDATCRIAELIAARGQPEEAARWAERARHIDLHSERAARLFVSSILATGDRSAAGAAAKEFEALFAESGVALEPATNQLFARAR